MHPSKAMKAFTVGSVPGSVRVTCPALASFAILLFVHAAYLTNLPAQDTRFIMRATQDPGQAPRSNPVESSNIPQVLIFRRSKKTGSSSMLTTIAAHVEPMGYVPLYYTYMRMLPAVHAESLKENPRRLFVTMHNRVSRNTTNGLKTIIADTVSDGYRQVTSFCRYFQHVKDCDDEMARCMVETVSITKYRWAGNKDEDASTYIDLPLSAAHPALSTTVFRHVFKNATLDVPKVNVVGSSCPENPRLRTLYNKLYRDLDIQVDRLRMRILAMADYPVFAEKQHNITTEELLDRAEEMEKRKYKFGSHDAYEKMSDKIHEWWRNRYDWIRSEKGDIVLKHK